MIKNVFSIFIALSVLTLFSCNKQLEEIENEENLPTGVVSVKIIEHNDVKFKGFRKVLSTSKHDIDVNGVIGNYVYENKYESLVFEDVNGFYYAYVFNPSNENEYILAKLTVNFEVSDENPFVQDIEYLIESGFGSKSSWGKCMKGAISLLYDDWENDPAGTFSCWVTGPICAVGGGIWCAFQ